MAITLPIPTLTVGNYLLKIIATDGLGGSVVDLVQIEVKVEENPSNPPDGESDDGTNEGNDDTNPSDSNESNSPDYLLPLLLSVGLVAGVSSVVAVRRMHYIHPSDIKRTKIPYKPIRQHVLNLYAYEKGLQHGEQTLDEKQMMLNQLKTNAQGAFAEGAYLEAIALYGMLVQLLAELNLKEELHTTQIKLTFLQQAVNEKDFLLNKIENEPPPKFEEIEQLYNALLVACRKLNDLGSIEYYLAELKVLKQKLAQN